MTLRDEAVAYLGLQERIEKSDPNHPGHAKALVTNSRNLARVLRALLEEEGTPTRIIVPASTKGEQGWLHVREVGSQTWYGVTMDESQATEFRTFIARNRAIERAREAGLTIPVLR